VNDLVPLAVAGPLAGAAAVLFLNAVVSRRVVQVLTLVVVVAEVGVVTALMYQARSGPLVYWFGGWTPHAGVALGVSFTVDQFGAGAAVLAAIIVSAAVATTRWTVEGGDGIVHALLLTLLAGMTGFCLTGDLFNLFVFFELMAVSAFGLAAYPTRSRGALRSALNFAVANSIGAFLVLIGIALLYARTGALNLAQIGRQLAATGRLDRLTILALALLVVGFLVKAAVAPFHLWLVDTASSAPLPLAMVLAGVLDALGLYAVARIYWAVFAIPLTGDHRAVQTLLISIGAISALIGGAMAALFREPGRRLGFVMVSHTGIVLIGIGCLTAPGLAGAAVYAVSDGTAKAALFAGAAALGLRRSDDDEPANELPPARRRAGVALLAVGGLAAAGLPVFGTGLGKAAIEDAAAAAGYGWAPAVVVLATILTAAAVLDMAWTASRSTAGVPRAGTTPTTGRRHSWVPTFAVGAALVGVSAAARGLGRWATSAAAGVVDSAAYQQRVLGGAPVPAGRMPGAIGLSSGAALVDLATVGAAIGLAAGANVLLTRPTRIERSSRLRAVLDRLHDGSIGDSVTWLTVGTATIAVALTAGLR
jgi:multicomponent Na+:H+ antiporter subunit D